MSLKDSCAWTLGHSAPSSELPGSVGDRDGVMSPKFLCWTSSPQCFKMCIYGDGAFGELVKVGRGH